MTNWNKSCSKKVIYKLSNIKCDVLTNATDADNTLPPAKTSHQTISYIKGPLP